MQPRPAHRLFGFGSGDGTVRTGHRAGLVLLQAGPLADIRNDPRIAGAAARGRRPGAARPTRFAGQATRNRSLQAPLGTNGSAR